MTLRTTAARLLLPALLTIVSPAAGTAQTNPTLATLDDFRSRARMRTGPLFLTPRFTLDGLGVDTNVFNAAVDPERDFVVAAGPEVDLWLPFRRRALLATTIAARAEYFREFASERSLNPAVRSRFDVAVRRLTFFAAGRWLDTRQRPAFEMDLRARRVDTGANLGVGAVLAPRLSVELEWIEDRLRFDGDVFFEGTALAEILNRRERAGRAAFRWRRTALSTFVLAAEFRRMRFDLSPERDSKNLIVTAGGEFHPRALVSGSGQVGVRRFKSLGAAVADTARVVASADLTFDLPGNMTAAVETERDIEYSFTRLDPFYVVTRYGLAVTRRLGGPYEVTGRLVRDTYDYLGPTGPTGRRDVARNVSGTLGYRLNDTTRVGFRVGYVTRRSTTARWRYESLQAGLVFEYGV